MASTATSPCWALRCRCSLQLRCHCGGTEFSFISVWSSALNQSSSRGSPRSAGRARSILPACPPMPPGGSKAAGYELTDQPVNLPTVLPRCRAVVHYGGHGLAAAAIAAGLPQIVVSTDFEKWLIGRKIEAEGAGCLLGMRNLALPRFVQALRFVRLAPEPFDKALAIAGEMQPWFSTAPEERQLRSWIAS